MPAGWVQRTPAPVGWGRGPPHWPHGMGPSQPQVLSGLQHGPGPGAQGAGAAARIKARLCDSRGFQLSEAVGFVEADARSVNPYSDFLIKTVRQR